MCYSKKIITILILMLTIVLLNLSYVLAEEAKYVGAGKCKMCHLLQHKSWQSGKHAQALSLLKEDEAKDPKCLECHTTGYGKAQAEGADLANVQCEACHGAGSLYKNSDIMKDREKAKAAGLIIPNEETCRSCHNERNPFNKPFDYKERLKTGVHEHKS